MDILHGRRVRVPESVLYREIDGESVLLDLRRESYYGLDDVGTRMWQAVTETGSLAEAHASLLDDYGVDAETLRCDLAELVDKLAEQGLLELYEPTD